MNIQTKKLSDLKPADCNPRTISKRAMAGLAASLDRFGNVQPIVWNERSGNVVGGHQRLKLLQAQGAEDTPVVVVDFDEMDERALNIALNHSGIMGEFDENLEELVRDLDLPEGVFDALNFDDLLPDEPFSGTFKEMKLKAPPEITWVLIGIPTVRYIEISAEIEHIAGSEDVIVETTISGK